MYSDGRKTESFTILGGGSQFPASHETLRNNMHTFKMNGKDVYDTATRVLPKSIISVLKESQLTIKDVKCMIPHQPNIGILKRITEILGLPFNKVMTNMDRYANTSGGTIPLLLDEVVRSGKIQKDDIILFAAVGAGLTYSAAVINWG